MMKKIFAIFACIMLIVSFPMAAFADARSDGASENQDAENEVWMEYNSIDELDGKIIGVQTAVLYEELLFDRLPNATYQYYTMPNDMILALTSGKVSSYLIEGVSFYVQKANHPELEHLEEPAGTSEYACVIGNNDRQEKTLAEMNEFIANKRADGTMDRLYDYWIMNFDPDTSAIDESLRDCPNVNGTLEIAIEGGYEPFSFISNGVESGFDVEFMLMFCKEYGYEPVFYEVPFESIAPGAESGRYDVGLNIVVSDERSDSAVLTDVYYDCPIYLVVLGDDEDNLNIFGKLKRSFYKTFIKENRWILFAQGTGITIVITICSVLFGTIIGFLLFMACRHGNKVANGLTDFYRWLIHGIPTVVLLMILYYIVFGASNLSGVWISIVGFTMMFSCSMYDMLLTGTGAVPKGQTEASRALGYSDKQSFFKIILPQAARHFLPIYKNELVTLIKETSVVGYIAVLDLTKISDLVRSRTYEAFFPLIATAIVYFIIAGIMTRVVGRLEFDINPRRRNKDKILKGINVEE